MKENHDPSRRNLLAMLTGLPFISRLSGKPVSATPSAISSSLFPAKELFDIHGTYINAAYIHPMSKGSRNAIDTYLNERMVNGRLPHYDMDATRKDAKNLFAQLIHADVDEIAWVPSTMAGENTILNGLSIPGTKSKVVTDAYHFSGSLFLYNELAKKGLDLEIVRPYENRIRLEDLDTAITPGTKLVALSLVSSFNGFQHDLKKVCDMAHAKNVLVFADIIQAAGAVPINVKESGVDFCSCATYKWLMGDFGAGFLYVRKDKMDLLKRSQIGYRQEASFISHVYPFDEPGSVPFESESKQDASGHVEVGTLANEAIPSIRHSLNYLLNTNVEKIEAYRAPMIQLLQEKLPSLGFMPLTSLDSKAPVISFAYRNASDLLKPKLDAAGINISLYQNRIRISPSVYNDLDDIQRLIKALT